MNVDLSLILINKDSSKKVLSFGIDLDFSLPLA